MHLFAALLVLISLSIPAYADMSDKDLDKLQRDLEKKYGK